MTNDVSLQTDEELRAHLHGETSKLPWSDLENYFARGVVLKVAKGTDILDVAIIMSRDNKDTLQQMIEDKKVTGAEIEDAKKWHESSASLWAVVIAPWVLVQEVD
jgi:hypothetical protein